MGKKGDILEKRALTNQILTEEEQAKLTPEEVLTILKQGNNDFTNDNLTVRNNSQRVREAVMGQYPKAVVLSCIDSRVPVEDIFHRGIGDIFVARVAGNIINKDILGSLEFACKISKAKVILVLGHEHCSAVKSAIDNINLGNILFLLAKIHPAIKEVSENYSLAKTSSNKDFVNKVCACNVLNSIKEIKKNSPILKEMEQRGEIYIKGAIYNMTSGKVSFLD
ncbi:carbonic anhydrase [Parelusimicrobium proximum]|uniref:carbonic anhydrase family protein n=1 Tax=Parelusimicrobium proximum TaxID=3228953 RepID=UPI003D1704FB